MMIDWSTVGTAIAALGTVATAAYAGWLKLKKNAAETNAQVAIVDAQRTVYDTLNHRITTMEADIKELRAELAEERKHSRALEQKLAALMAWIRAQGLTPPAL